jgi:hypothetical protein
MKLIPAFARCDFLITIPAQEKEEAVPTSLSQNLPETLKALRTRPLFVLHEQVLPLLVIGQFLFSIWIRFPLAPLV